MSGWVRSPAQGRASTPERGELPDPLGHADRVEVAGDDLGAGLPEGERDGVADLARPADAGHQHDLAGEVESPVAHDDLRDFENDVRTRRTGLTVEDRGRRGPTSTTERRSLAVRPQRAVRPADREPGIGQQRKRQAEPRGITARGSPPTPDSPRTAGHCRLSYVQDLIAHGGELAISAGRVVAGIEQQQDPRVAPAARVAVGPPVGRRGREVGRGISGCRGVMRSRSGRGRCLQPLEPLQRHLLGAERAVGLTAARDRRASRCRRCGAGPAAGRCR